MDTQRAGTVDTMKHIKLKVLATKARVTRLNSLIDELNALIENISQTKFLQQAVGDDKRHVAVISAKENESKETETLAAIRRAIELGINEVDAVSTLPDLIGSSSLSEPDNAHGRQPFRREDEESPGSRRRSNNDENPMAATQPVEQDTCEQSSEDRHLETEQHAKENEVPSVDFEKPVHEERNRVNSPPVKSGDIKTILNVVTTNSSSPLEQKLEIARSTALGGVQETRPDVLPRRPEAKLKVSGLTDEKLERFMSGDTSHVPAKEPMFNKEVSRGNSTRESSNSSRQTPTTSLPQKLLGVRVAEKYKSIFEDEDDDDDLFDVKPKKVEIKEPKKPQSKLAESQFAKVLGEKLARGPVQVFYFLSDCEVFHAPFSQLDKELRLHETKPATAIASTSIAPYTDVIVPEQEDSQKLTESKDSDDAFNDEQAPTASASEGYVESPVAPLYEDHKKEPVEASPDMRTFVKVGSIGVASPVLDEEEPAKAKQDQRKISQDTGKSHEKFGKNSHSEAKQHSAVKSFFDADSDDGEEDDTDDTLILKKEDQSPKSAMASEAKASSSASKPIIITAQSLFDDDDESDLSIFRKK
ncbi:unnamed protein product [Strongylus vulgaris]|uniref:Uncharacterized protein n=1 Tax=Strongylus vulgaris TaxID=40348 RepID=A0A3P7J535_STRVU|nr:unnamed protein product [Strongylus vulgaris]